MLPRAASFFKNTENTIYGDNITMKCAIRFCGGCNPRYDRGKAFREIRDEFVDIEFPYAREDEEYDCLLVIGGCSNCCASYDQYDVKGDVLKMWDESHLKNIKKKLSAIRAEQEDD